jgi:histone-lysine N-methyltransferase SETMAR
MATIDVRIRDRAIVEMCFKMEMTQVQCFDHLYSLSKRQGPSQMTINKYYHELYEGTFSYVDILPEPKGPNPELVAEIDRVITQDPYLSLRKIAEEVNSNKDTVRSILIKSLGMTKIHCKWIPHYLTDAQKLTRVLLAKDMLKTLTTESNNHFRNLITGDESWFLYNYPDKSYWDKSIEPRREIVRPAIDTPKVMIVIFWGVSEVPVLSFLNRGEGMTAARFHEIVLKPLIKLNESRPSDNKLLLHWDNAPAHTAKVTKAVVRKEQLKILPQPPYSPDLSPSDFFLFGYVKSQLRGKKCKDSETLLTEIRGIVSSIPVRKRVEVFEEWIWRLKSVISSGGEYCK